MIEQRGLLNHLLSKISDLELSASDVIAQTAPQSFRHLGLAVPHGPDGRRARPHLCRRGGPGPGAADAGVIRREGVTVLQIVPSLLRAILDRMPNESIACALSRLRWLICIGEALAPDLCRSWFRHFPGVPLINAYGPAECSDTSRRIACGAAAALARHRADRPRHCQHTPLCAGRSHAAGADRGRGRAMRRRHRRGSRLPQRSRIRPGEAFFATRSRSVAERGCTGPETWPAGALTEILSLSGASTIR